MRADAGGLRGSGHVMRCLALAQAWIDTGGAVTLVAAAGLPPPLAARARAEGIGVVEIAEPPGAMSDAAATRALVAEVGAAALVIDGYQFDAAYIAAAAGAAPTCVIDDGGHVARYPVRWVLNQNAHARPELYAAKAEGATLLLGGAFALLRREFRAPPQAPRAGVFATFGGVDPHGASEVFLEAVARLGADAPEGIVLAVGAANGRADALERQAQTVGVAVVRDVRDMAARLAGAALVVTAGGSTLWEGCACAAPMLVVSVIPEEAESAAALAARGGCRYAGPLAAMAPDALAAEIAALWSDGAARAMISGKAHALVDGQGAARVASILRGGATPR